jgi:hypothetical protein
MELTVTTFIESLPEHAESIVVRVGEVRTKLNIVHKFDRVPDDLSIEQVLTANGYAETCGYARLIAYGPDGKQVRSCSLSCEIETDNDHMGRLIDGILRSNACIRRNHTAAISHNERLLATIERLAELGLEKDEELIEYQHQALAEKADILEATLAEIEGKEGMVDVQTRAINVFEKAIGVVAGQKKDVTIDDIAAAVIEHPERIGDLLQHDGVMEAVINSAAVQQKIFGDKKT